MVNTVSIMWLCVWCVCVCVCGYISMSCASSSDKSLMQLSEEWSFGSLRASSVAYFFVYSAQEVGGV